MALFKKGKKGAGGKVTKKGKRIGDQQQYMQDNMVQDQYGNMITPRNDQMMQNMERVDEDQEEDMAAHDESQ